MARFMTYLMCNKYPESRSSSIQIFSMKLLFAVFSYLLILASSDADEWNTKDYLKKEHSLVKPYTDDRWEPIGSTLVTTSYVRLTPDHQSRKGGIWNKIPCFVRNWELHVHFKVHGKGGDLFGDGFAVWYTKDRSELGPVFGNRDFFSGLAVFFDTYNNEPGKHSHSHPYISAMVNNGTIHYDHDRDGTHTELAGCESKFRGTTHETFIAIRYEKNRLTISMDIEGKNTWQPCFAVDGVHLPTGYYFGASAATGELADNHDILSVKLYDVSIEGSVDTSGEFSGIVPHSEHSAAPRAHIHSEGGDKKVEGGSSSTSSGGWGYFFMSFFIILLLGCAAAVGYYMYNESKRKKRLY